MNYLINSFHKFKSEIVSKGLYDIFKAFLIFISGLLSTFLFSLLPSIKVFLSTKITISYYLIIILILIFCCLLYLIIKNKSKLDKLIKENNIDELTGLKNHKALATTLNSTIEDFKENTSMILIDVDDFKSFNSKFSYSEADIILKKLGELLGNDKRATDETFRFFHRGDEFFIVAKETTLNQALQAAERKRKLVSQNLFSVDDRNHKLTISCGVTTLKKEDTVESITERLSTALKEAKKVKGKNNSKPIS